MPTSHTIFIAPGVREVTRTQLGAGVASRVSAAQEPRDIRTKLLYSTHEEEVHLVMR